MERLKEQPINVDKAKYIVDGDRELLNELVDIFVDTYPDQLAKIKEAIVRREVSSFRHETHQIKGALRNFAAERAQKAASELEDIDVITDRERVHEKFENLRKELEVLETYVKSGEFEKHL